MYVTIHLTLTSIRIGTQDISRYTGTGVAARDVGAVLATWAGIVDHALILICKISKDAKYYPKNSVFIIFTAL
jgi:hypothetical protein